MPTPGYNPFKTRIDFYRLIRNIKLRKLFGDSPLVFQPFKKPSTFVPNVQDTAITVFERLVLKEIEDLEKNKIKTRYNLTREQVSRLRALALDPTLTIKPADKGGGLVILDTDVYQQEVLRQLEDRNFYEKLEHDPTSTFQKLVRIVLSEGLALDFITKDLYDFMLNTRKCQFSISCLRFSSPASHQGDVPSWRPIHPCLRTYPNLWTLYFNLS